MDEPADAPGLRVTARFVTGASPSTGEHLPGDPEPAGDVAAAVAGVPEAQAAPSTEVTASRVAAVEDPAVGGSGAEAPAPEASAPEAVADDETPAVAPRARVEELDLGKPWVANVSTALIAVGVLLVLVAIVSKF